MVGVVQFALPLDFPLYYLISSIPAAATVSDADAAVMKK
jgi:hypothetical protein